MLVEMFSLLGLLGGRRPWAPVNDEMQSNQSQAALFSFSSQHGVYAFLRLEMEKHL